MASDTKLGEPGSVAWAPSGALMYEHEGRVRYIPKDAIPAVLAALLSDAPIVEIYHYATKAHYAHGETETDMLNERANIVDPIGVARRIEEGRYRLVKVEADG